VSAVDDDLIDEGTEARVALCPRLPSLGRRRSADDVGREAELAEGG
jgi:hypothetical protein